MGHQQNISNRERRIHDQARDPWGIQETVRRLQSTPEWQMREQLRPTVRDDEDWWPAPTEAATPAPVATVKARRRGRPSGVRVDSANLRKLRGSLSQERFAEECGVSLPTIQRGEAGARLSTDMVDKIQDYLKRAGRAGARLTVEDDR